MTTAVKHDVDWTEYRSMVPIGTNPERDTPAWQIRESIILKYLYLTKNVVSNLMKTLPPHVDREDLESQAAFGLMRAVLRFDSTMGVPFEAFATRSILSCVGDGIRAQDWAPRSLRKKQRDIKNAEEKLSDELKRTPTEYEIATYLGIEAHDVSETKYKCSVANHVYLDSSLDNIPEAIIKTDLTSQLRSVLVDSFLSLPTREAVIVALYYYEKKKLAEIADILNISVAKCGQLHRQAVMELWTNLEKTLNDD